MIGKYSTTDKKIFNLSVVFFEGVFFLCSFLSSTFSPYLVSFLPPFLFPSLFPLFLSSVRYLCWFFLFLVISASICWILPVLSTSSSFFTKLMVSNFILYCIFLAISLLPLNLDPCFDATGTSHRLFISQNVLKLLKFIHHVYAINIYLASTVCQV